MQFVILEHFVSILVNFEPTIKFNLRTCKAEMHRRNSGIKDYGYRSTHAKFHYLSEIKSVLICILQDCLAILKFSPNICIWQADNL